MGGTAGCFSKESLGQERHVDFFDERQRKGGGKRVGVLCQEHKAGKSCRTPEEEKIKKIRRRKKVYREGGKERPDRTRSVRGEWRN